MHKYLLRKADIEAFEGLQKVHFLNANAVRTNKSLGDLTGLTGFGFHLIEIAPGRDSTEYHNHYYEDECVYVLQGQGIARIGEQYHDIGPGDFIGYCKGGLAHSLHNNGNDMLRCIVVGERREHDMADYPDKQKRIYRNQGQFWDLVDIEAIVHPQAGRKI
ncbi:cupin domain-containing protein [Bowmanella denitrificans]|uniref:cupin domain-containing protein n=1 Tax=Bowmanella denitrificans TaxID=366582 RepID=UPI000C9CA8D3|nr:cupin domain-containing protein [Bowmanella denitrificans]